MELIFNDLSIHGQFHDLEAFRDAIGRVMTIRSTARRFGIQLQCHRNIGNAKVTPELTMPEVAHSLGKDKCRVLMQWLTQRGPFWEDAREHSCNDWLECNGEIVTDYAIGEAAYCLFQGIECSLVSMDPSRWLTSSLTVVWRENDRSCSITIPNYWDADTVKTVIEDRPVTLESWKGLESTAQSRCPDLTFSKDSFKPLDGLPFSRGTAEGLLFRLAVLNNLKNCFDEQGMFTPEGHQLYQKHFTGDKAWFSDSSDTEKVKFKADLTFRHPTNDGEFLLCTWHGKVKTPQLRVHFSWPIQANEPLYVVYVGPKITKR